MSNSEIAVVYRSKSGYTRKYAEWLSQALSGDLFDAKKTKATDLLTYRTIIYGGGLYMGGIHGVKLIQKNFQRFTDKTLVVFAVGATPTRPETTKELLHLIFTPEQQKKIAFFYLRGGFEYARLTRVDKILMTLLKVKLKHMKNPSPDAKGMLTAYEHPADFTRKDRIAPVVAYVKDKS